MKNVNREKIREAILNGVEQAMDKIESQYDSASEKTSQVIGSVKEKAAKAYGDVGEKAAAAKERTDNYVRENPEKSILIAAGIGAIAALVASAVIKKRRGNCRHCNDAE